MKRADRQWRGYTLDQLRHQLALNRLRRHSLMRKLALKASDPSPIIEIIGKGYRLYKEWRKFFCHEAN